MSDPTQAIEVRRPARGPADSARAAAAAQQPVNRNGATGRLWAAAAALRLTAHWQAHLEACGCAIMIS
jgi:hypothetical protein